jgi:hypothetical protein
MNTDVPSHARTTAELLLIAEVVARTSPTIVSPRGLKH